ncbi:DUF4112 domain-containing protein [Prevotella sp. SGI.027]
MSSPERKGQLMNSKLYQSMKYITIYLDKYHLDGIAGLVPGGTGDAVTAFFGLTHVYFAMFKLHSIPLTLAVLNNTLRDVLLGLIPFYVGNVIDFFHRSNKKNMALIDGFINDDKSIIKEVNKRALQAGVFLVFFIIAIAMMIALLIWLAKTLGTMIFS